MHELTTKPRRTRTFSRTNWILINCDKHNYYEDVQCVLAIDTQRTPIILTEPRQIYFRGQIFRRDGGDKASQGFGRYVCKESNNIERRCTANIWFEEEDSIMYMQVNLENKHVDNNCCISQQKLKIRLINQLIYNEIKNHVKMHNTHINPRHEYNRIIRKYTHQFPNFDPSEINPYESMQHKLRKEIRNVQALRHSTVASYISDPYGFTKTLNYYCPSASQRKKVKEQTIIKQHDDNLFITNTELMQIFFSAAGFAGDGTFNIRPVFLKPNSLRGRYKIHLQVFKIYAFFKYKTKNNEKVIKSYLIGVALLKNKKQEVYKWLFTQIRIIATEHSCATEHQMFLYMSDFEDAQRNGLLESFGNSDFKILLTGEEFHHKQAIYKNIKDKGLKIYYDVKHQTSNASESNQSNSNSTTTSKYDEIFRYHIELLYNLMYVHPNKVQEFGKVILRSLWRHIRKKYVKRGDTIKKFIDFILYYGTGWLEIKKNEYTKLLGIRKKTYVNHINNKNPRFIQEIKHWSVYDKILNNNNAVEGMNMWDRVKLGYYPTINKFILEYLYIFDDTIRRYKYHQRIKILPNQQQTPAMKKKKKIIKSFVTSELSITQYIKLSSILTQCKYMAKCKDIHNYFKIEHEDADNEPYIYSSRLNITNNTTGASSRTVNQPNKPSNEYNISDDTINTTPQFTQTHQCNISNSTVNYTETNESYEMLEEIQHLNDQETNPCLFLPDINFQFVPPVPPLEFMELSDSDISTEDDDIDTNRFKVNRQRADCGKSLRPHPPNGNTNYKEVESDDESHHNDKYESIRKDKERTQRQEQQQQKQALLDKQKTEYEKNLVIYNNQNRKRKYSQITP